jgi:tRNA threonylcarbamoyladenosine biosynthesis protein TsaB
MLLALDTATRLISLALHDGQAVIAESTWYTAGHHTAELAPQAALLLRRAGLEPARLRALAVAIGPGSYTGLRIGLGFAKGLALAHALPVFGVPTFDILLRAQPPRAEPVLGVLQAGRGRVLAARYRWDSARRHWEALEPARVLTWDSLAASLIEPTYVCGEVDAAGADALGARRGLVTLASPAQSLRRAGHLAEIGWERLRAGRDGAGDAARLAPLYAAAAEPGAPPSGPGG